jgi:hypothetical protein
MKIFSILISFIICACQSKEVDKVMKLNREIHEINNEIEKNIEEAKKINESSQIDTINSSYTFK